MGYGPVNVPGPHTHKRADITDFPTSMTPASHAAGTTAYGAGSAANYGHVKLSDSESDTSGASSGIAATPLAVSKANAAAAAAQKTANAANQAAQAAQSAASGGVKIEAGSYVGTGNTYASASNQKTLTFSFAPKVVIIVPSISATNSTGYNHDGTEIGPYYARIYELPVIIPRSANRILMGYSGNDNRGDVVVYLTWEGTTLKFYAKKDMTSSSYTVPQAEQCFDSPNRTYYWVAIG